MEGGGQGWRMDDGGEKPDGVLISHAGYSLIEVGVVLFCFIFFFLPIFTSSIFLFTVYPTRMVYDEHEQFTKLLGFFWTELHYRCC